MIRRFSWFGFWSFMTYFYWVFSLLCIIGTLTDNMHLGWTAGGFLALSGLSIFFAYLDIGPKSSISTEI